MIYTYYEPNSKLIRATAIWPVGQIHEQKKLQCQLLCRMLGSATLYLDSEKLHQQIDYYGGIIQFDNSATHITADISCSTSNFRPLLELFYQMIYYPVFTAHEWQILMNQEIERYFQDQKNPEVIADRLILRDIYGDTPYSYIASIEDYLSITIGDIIAYYDQHLRSTQPTWFLSGDIDSSDFELLELYHQSRLPDYEPIVPITKGLKVRKPKTYNYENTQKSIRLGRKITFENESQWLSLELYNMALGGHFMSALMQELRQKKGYTYGAYSFIHPFIHSGVLLISLQTDHKYANLALDTIFEIYQRFDSDIQALEEAYIHIKSSWMRNSSQIFNQTDYRISMYRMGLDYDRYVDLLHSFNISEIIPRTQLMGDSSSLHSIVI